MYHALLEVVKNLLRGDQTANLRSTISLFEDQARGKRLNDEIFVVSEESSDESYDKKALSNNCEAISQLN